jgi:hypothetical protein
MSRWNPFRVFRYPENDQAMTTQESPLISATSTVPVTDSVM